MFQPVNLGGWKEELRATQLCKTKYEVQLGLTGWWRGVK